MRQWLLMLAFCGGFAAGNTAAMAADPVDVALVLAVDISASVDATEHRLQMAGIAAALQSEEVVRAITAAPHKRISIAITQWSGTQAQFLVLPWTEISDFPSSRAAARRILTIARADEGGGTSISAALTHAARLFSVAPPATRRLIDISTDGINNIGPDLDTIRHQIDREGITINALAVAVEWPKLADYLEENVITGPSAFTVNARGFEDFAAAMQAKLLREIRGPGLT